MQTKQLETILRVILAAALAGPALGACGGQVNDQTNTGASGSAGVSGDAGSPGAGSGGSLAGAGSPGAGSGGTTAGAGGAAAGAGGAGAGTGGAAAGAGGQVAAGAGGTAAGGSPGGGAGGGTNQDFHPLSCNAILQGLAHDLGVDSVEIWRGFSDATGESTTSWGQVASDGTACVVPDPAACAQLLAQAANDTNITGLRPSSGGNTQPAFERVIATQSGMVLTAKDKPSLLKLFGNKLDTEAKLLLWLRYSFALGAPCDLLVRQVGDHFEVQGGVLISDCPITTEQQTLAVNVDGSIVILVHGEQSSSGACAGRRPAGLAPASQAGPDRTGQHFAAMAHLEAASVEAFARLTEELSLLGAPADLLVGCEQARQDEIRHATSMGQLAARFGAPVCPVSVAPVRARSAAEIAEENAIEGCVRETFGALVARFQAEQSRDEEVRAALAIIAEDETRHAALSWQIQGWLEQSAGCEGARARVQAAAVAGLRAEIDGGALDGGSLAGLPDRETARRLLEGLEAALLA